MLLIIIVSGTIDNYWHEIYLTYLNSVDITFTCNGSDENCVQELLRDFLFLLKALLQMNLIVS